jgi:hypothetical protein
MTPRCGKCGWVFPDRDAGDGEALRARLIDLGLHLLVAEAARFRPRLVDLDGE